MSKAQTSKGTRHIIEALSEKTQSDMVRGVSSALEEKAGEIIVRQVRALDNAHRSFAQSIVETEERMAQIRDVGTTRVLAWAALGGVVGSMLVGGVMWWLVSSGHIQAQQPTVTMKAKAVGQYIINGLRHK